MSIQADGRLIQTDDEGYLLDPDDWDEEIAERIAGEEGLELTDDHWNLIRFTRLYYERHRVTAEMRHVLKYLAQEMGRGESAKIRLYELFPYGFLKQACKIAGLRRPRSWSSG